jgi:hypothetical protein
MKSFLGFLALIFPKYFQELILNESNTQPTSGTVISGTCLVAGAFISFTGFKKPLIYSSNLFFDILSCSFISLLFAFDKLVEGVDSEIILKLCFLAFLIFLLLIFFPWSLTFSQNSEDLFVEYFGALENSGILVRF